MKKGQIYEGIVERIDFPNKAIVRIEEKQVVVKGALPKQKIRLVIKKIRNDKCEGKLLEILEKSPLESKMSNCPVFGSCGGCFYQTLPYEMQLAIKEEQVKRLLDSVCRSYKFEGIERSPSEWEYRNKMEFSFGDEYKDGPLALGLHKKGNFYDIVTVDHCKIVHSDYNQIVRTVLQYFTEQNTEFYHKMTKKGYLRHLLIRRAVKTGELLIGLVTTSQKEMDLTPLLERVCALSLEGTLIGFLHIINNSLSDTIQSDKTEILYGKDYFYEELLGLKFKISVFSFFQTNSLGAEVLYSIVRDYVGDTKEKVIFDLYSGTGTIAQILAPVAKKVIGIEIVEEAVNAARKNAEWNGLENVKFIAGDVLEKLDEIAERPDLIVLDPPRDGIHPKALNRIIKYGVERIVYISCKPTSLIRDLKILQENGYQVVKVKCMDMFPNTVHVETIVGLHRRDN